MIYSSFEETYSVIKEKGPISFTEIVECIAQKNNILPYTNYLGEFLFWPHETELAGYVGNLSKKLLIKHDDKSPCYDGKKLWYAIRKLNENEKAVYQMRNENKTFDDIGKSINLSKQRASQIYKKAIFKLKKPYRWTDELNRRVSAALLEAGVESKQRGYRITLLKEG